VFHRACMNKTSSVIARICGVSFRNMVLFVSSHCGSCSVFWNHFFEYLSCVIETSCVVAQSIDFVFANLFYFIFLLPFGFPLWWGPDPWVRCMRCGCCRLSVHWLRSSPLIRVNWVPPYCMARSRQHLIWRHACRWAVIIASDYMCTS
jgi:hypothetical protein